MSIVITVERGDEKFDVEVFHDGKIDFPNDDLRYGQASEEFYNAKTNVVRFCNLWKKDPMEAIADSLWVIDKPFLLFMADCAEHVLPLLNDRYPWISGLDRALEMARMVSADGLSKTSDRYDYLVVIGELRILDEEITSLASMFSGQKNNRLEGCVLFAVSEVSDRNQPVWRCDNPADSYDAVQFLFAAMTAVKAAGFKASPDENSAKWKQAYRKEAAWQIRRFVDIMEAVGQGLDWPDLGATK